MRKQKSPSKIEGLCKFWIQARSARPSIGTKGRMMMRRKQERLHSEVTVTQALVIVNGKCAQIAPDIWPRSLVDLPEACPC
jgi:hypothetical protein